MDLTGKRFPLSRKTPFKKALAVVFILLPFFILFCFVFKIAAFAYKVQDQGFSQYGINFPLGPSSDEIFSAWIPVWFGLFLLITILTYLYQLFFFKRFDYHLAEDRVFIRQGVLYLTEITLAYDKIYDVAIEQDLLDTLFGIYNVHFLHAATASNMTAHIDGLSKEAAQSIRKFVLSKVREKAHRSQE